MLDKIKEIENTMKKIGNVEDFDSDIRRLKILLKSQGIKRIFIEPYIITKHLNGTRSIEITLKEY